MHRPLKIFIVLSVIAAVVLFRHTLMLLGIDLLLSATFPLNYEKIEWQEGKVVMTGVQIQDETLKGTCDRVEIDLSLHRFRLEPHLLFSHPEIVINQSQNSQPPSVDRLALLLPSKWCTIKVDVQNGVVLFDRHRIFFAFQSGAEKQQIGTLSLFGDPALAATPEASFSCEVIGDQLKGEFNFQDLSCERMIEGLKLIGSPIQSGWEEVKGIVQAEGMLQFDSKLSIQQLSCLIDVKNLCLSNSILGFHVEAEELHSEFTYPSENNEASSAPFWKQILTISTLEQGEIIVGDFGISDVSAQILFDPLRDPYLNLTGTFIHHDDQFPISLEGKGSVHEDQSFWLELSAKIADKTAAFLSICSPEKENYVIAADVKNLSCDQVRIWEELIHFSYPEMQKIELHEGQIAGKVVAWLNRGDVYRLQIENLDAHGIEFLLPEYKTRGLVKDLTGEVRLARDGKGEWQIHHLNADLHQGQVQGEKWNGSDLEMHFNIENKRVHPSWIKGNIAGVPTEVLFQGASLETEITLQVKADSGQLFQALHLNLGEQKQDIEVNATIKKRAEGYNLAGILSCLEGNVDFGCDFLPLNNGWIRAEKVPSLLYSPLINAFYPELTLSGDCDLFGTFDKSNVEMSLQASDLFLEHPDFYIFIPNIGVKDPSLINTQGRAKIAYKFDERDLQVSFPLIDAVLEEKKRGLRLEKIRASVEMKGGHLTLEECSAECDGLQMEARCDIDFNQEWDLTLTTSKIFGNASSLLRLAKHWYPNLSFDVPIEGEVVSGKNGFNLFCRKADDGIYSAWQLQAGLRQLNLPLNKVAKLQNGQCDIVFDSNSNELYVRNGFAEVITGDKVYAVKADLQKKKLWELDLEMADGIEETLRIIATGEEKTPLSIHFDIDPSKSHFFGINVQSSHIQLQDFKLEEASLSTEFAAEDLKHFLGSLKDFGIIDENPLNNWDISGKCFCDLAVHKGGDDVSISLRSALLDVEELGKESLNIRLQKKNSEWVLELLQWGDIEFHAAGFSHGPYFSLSRLDGSWGKHQFQGDAVYDSSSKMISGTIKSILLDIDAPLPLHAQNGGAIPFTYQKGGPLNFGQIDLFIQDQYLPGATSQCLLESLTFFPELSKWHFKKLQFHLSSQMVEEFTEKQKLPTFLQTMRKDGSLSGVAEGEYFSASRLWNMGVKTEWQQKLLFLTVHLDCKDALQGVVKVQESLNDTGLRCLFTKDGLNKVDGTFSGIECNLNKKSKGILEGSIRSDLSQVSKWLPPDLQATFRKFGLGRGGEFNGTIQSTPLRIKGTLKGDEVDLFGYIMHGLSAELDCQEGHFSLRNLSLADPAVMLTVKEAKASRKNGNWEMEIPHLHIRDFRPSALQKQVAGDSKPKPFFIKNLSFVNVKGMLGDAKTFTGQGECQFTNAFVKEYQLIDLPLEFFKNLGLDPGLFTPVYGEVECHLQGGKCWLKNLRNTHSEGKRSIFSLVTNSGGAYIDFDGNLRIDLKMKQNVALNITEPFTLNVRGTLEKPRYSLTP